MKKLFLILGLIAGFCLANMPSAQASTHTTLTGGLNCVCQDADNWVDLMTPSMITVSCPGLGGGTYRDTQISSSVIREYSCSSFPGATPASVDNITGKVIVSYVDKTCPRGYAVSTVPKVTSLGNVKGNGVTAYCASTTVKPVVDVKADVKADVKDTPATKAVK